MTSAELPPGRELTVSLAEAARRLGVEANALRTKLVREEWARIARLTWASLASSSTVRFRFFDELDDHDRPRRVSP